MIGNRLLKATDFFGLHFPTRISDRLLINILGQSSNYSNKSFYLVVIFFIHINQLYI